MFRSKSDVERHVQLVLKKAKTDQERNLRCYNIAQLFYKVQDYDSARKYVLLYLSEKEESALAHKLLGYSLEGLGQKTKAIEAYKRSLELEANQPELVLKICELLCDEFDPSLARYWIERASALFPFDSSVFMLKEKLLSSDSSTASNDFEELLNAELKARPNDISIRIKLLKLHVDSGRVESAYKHAVDMESKQTQNKNLAWYQCFADICKAFIKEHPTKCDWEFFMQWISAADRVCFFALSEIENELSDLSESAQAVLNLDQIIFKSTLTITKPTDFYKHFMKYISAQLAFHISLLLIKRAKQDSSLWKETKKMISPLLLFSVSGGRNNDVWCFSPKEIYKKMLTAWSHQNQCRCAQAGHLLLSLVKEAQNEKSFIENAHHYAVNNWKQKIYKILLESGHGFDEMNSSTSYFVSRNSYTKVPSYVPSAENLNPSTFIASFEINYLGSLHHLVWLGLRSLNNPHNNIVTSFIAPEFKATGFDNLQFTFNNLNNAGVETLNQLDIDSFLYSTVFCSGIVVDEYNVYSTRDKLRVLPADLTPSLCSSEQSKWWTGACSISKLGGRSLGNNSKMADLRLTLQRGIEIIRGEGLPIQIIVCLARTFSNRVGASNNDQESAACENRALYLWRLALPLLERHSTKQSINRFNNKLFDFPPKELTAGEVSWLLDEGRLAIAISYMKAQDYQAAIDTFKQIRNAQSHYNTAICYQRIAEDLVDADEPLENVTSEIRCRQAILITKARDSLQMALRADAPPSLQRQIRIRIGEVDDMLSRCEPENGVHRETCNTDGSHSFGSEASPVGQQKSGGRSYLQNTSRFATSSTPYKIYNNHRQSDDVVELMNTQQSNTQLKLQQIFEHTKFVKDMLECVVTEQKSQKATIETLNQKVTAMEGDFKAMLIDIKKEVRQNDLMNTANLDEDDYTDEMLQYQSMTQRQPAPPQFAPGAVPPYVSPRLDQMQMNQLCQGVGAYNPFGYYNPSTLPFSEQAIPDYLRTAQMFHKLPGAQGNFPGNLMGISAASALNNLAKMAQPGFPPGVGNTDRPIDVASATLPSASGVQPMAFGKVGQPVYPSGIGSANIVITTADTLPTQASSQPMTFGKTTQLGGFSSAVGPTNVVITTSDTLPTSAGVQPTLSVTIPAHHRLGDSPHPPPPRKPALDPAIFDKGEVLFEAPGKMSQSVGAELKEKGVGPIQVVTAQGKTVILMRKEDSPQILLALQLITPNSELIQGIGNSLMYTIEDYSEETPVRGKYTVTFKFVDQCQGFRASFERGKNNEKPQGKSPAPVLAPPKLQLSQSSSPFDFNKTSEKPAEPKQLFGANKDSPFSFGAPSHGPTAPSKDLNPEASPFSFTKKPFTFSEMSKQDFGTLASMAQAQQEDTDAQKEDDEFVPSIVFKPVVSLPELAEVKTGEEGETVLFKERGKLYRHSKETKEWKERGVGDMKILKNEETGICRLVMRREQVLKICCNHRITPSLVLKPFQTSQNAFTWDAKDFSEEKEVHEIFCLKFKNPDIAARFKEVFEQAQASQKQETTKTTIKEIIEEKPPLSSLVKHAKDSWECSGCFVRNTSNVATCSCCGTAKPGTPTSITSSPATSSTPSTKSDLKPLSALVSVAKGSWECQTCLVRNNAEVDSCSACQTPKPGSAAPPKPVSTFSFGVPSTTQGFFGSASSFSSLPTSASTGFVFGMPSETSGETKESTPSKPFSFGIPPQESTFQFSLDTSSQPATTLVGNVSAEENDENEHEDSTDNIHFQPVVPLPDKIEVKTGEEEEIVLYSQRARLYRFDPKSKEWKERGAGDIKILYHSTTHKKRLLMRREPIMKICLNQSLTSELELKKQSANSWFWAGYDFSNEEMIFEKFAIRFKLESSAQEFKSKIDEIKSDEYKPEMQLTPESINVQPDLTEGKADSDIEIVYEKKVSDELREKALSFKLPPNFYSYLDKPPCPGCVGCEKDEDTPKPNIFGGSGLFGKSTTFASNSLFGGSPFNSKVSTEEEKEKSNGLFSSSSFNFSSASKPIFGNVPASKSDSAPVFSFSFGSTDKKDETKSAAPLFSTTGVPGLFSGFNLPSATAVTTSSGDSSSGQTFPTFGSGPQFPVSKAPLEDKSGPVSGPGLIKAPTFSFSGNTSTKPLFPSEPVSSGDVSSSAAEVASMTSSQPKPEPNALPSVGTGALALALSGAGGDMPSFGSLAASSASSYGNIGAKKDGFKWEGSGTTLFGAKPAAPAAVVDKQEEQEEVQEADPDPQFQPVIDLPDIVPLSTGEEDENVLFCERVKLFRHAPNKEWKERGIGNLKLLKHRTYNTYRLLMRREQVHKIVCNHLVSHEFTLRPMPSSDKALMWVAMNLSQDQTNPVAETLAARFKDAKVAADFKLKVEEAVADLASRRSQT